MIQQEVMVCDYPRTIYTAESAAETREFYFLIGNDGPWAFDVETNAYPIHHPDFRIRLIQFGDCYNAYIFPVERLGAPMVRKLLKELTELVAHNAKYDILSLASQGYVPSAEALAEQYVDTRLLTHLIDPRGRQDGGIGQRLVDVCKHYLDDSSSDSDKELARHFKSLGFKTKEEGYRRVTLFDPIYLEYSGLDVINTALLYDTVAALVREQQR